MEFGTVEWVFGNAIQCNTLGECALSPSLLVGVTPQPWWSDEIPKDGYIHANLARHLSMCDRGSELATLLLDARWLNVRGMFGGILGLKADFAILDKLLQPFDGDGGEKKGVRRSVRLILKAMELSWGNFSDGSRAFQFQMCGRLLSLRSSDVVF